MRGAAAAAGTTAAGTTGAGGAVAAAGFGRRLGLAGAVVAAGTDPLGPVSRFEAPSARRAMDLPTDVTRVSLDVGASLATVEAVLTAAATLILVGPIGMGAAAWPVVSPGLGIAFGGTRAGSTRGPGLGLPAEIADSTLAGSTLGASRRALRRSGSRKPATAARSRAASEGRRARSSARTGGGVGDRGSPCGAAETRAFLDAVDAAPGFRPLAPIGGGAGAGAAAGRRREAVAARTRAASDAPIDRIASRAD